jgi:hypothetical protein
LHERIVWSATHVADLAGQWALAAALLSREIESSFYELFGEPTRILPSGVVTIIDDPLSSELERDSEWLHLELQAALRPWSELAVLAKCTDTPWRRAQLLRVAVEAAHAASCNPRDGLSALCLVETAHQSVDRWVIES